jgi:hypothetical protein
LTTEIDISHLNLHGSEAISQRYFTITEPVWNGNCAEHGIWTHSKPQTQIFHLKKITVVASHSSVF